MLYALAEYNQPCTPTLSGFYGLGAALTPAQRKAKQDAVKAANLAKRTQRKAIAAAKKEARVAGRKVFTSKPDIANKINAAVQEANKRMLNVRALTATAQRTRRRADIQKALVEAQSAGKFISTLNAQPSPAMLRGLMGLGACVEDGQGGYFDDVTQQVCDPSQQIPTDAYPGGGGFQPPYQQPGTSYPGYPSGGGYPGLPLPSPTGLVPGFGVSPFGGGYGSSPYGYGAPSGCRAGSNLPRCLIYQMAVEERQQFAFVFSILQQMYAQLLQIVQQLLVQLQSAQQAPYGYGQTSPYGGQYGPYSDPNNPLYGNQYGGYGGQYPGPGYPGVPYYPGGADSSIIPPGYGDSGGDPFGAGGAIPGDITQVFPGPGPLQYGPVGSGPTTGANIISSDSLPAGADTSDAFGGEESFVPAYTPAPQSAQPLPVQSSGQSSQSVTSGPTTPTVIVLQQGPGQSSYADTGLPAGPSQDQPSLEPPEIEGWARDN